jgi:hypothetical protein
METEADESDANTQRLEESVEKKLIDKVNDVLERSPSPIKFDIRKEAERIALIIREEIEFENQMSIEKKRKRQYEDVKVSKYHHQNQPSIGSLSYITD